MRSLRVPFAIGLLVLSSPMAMAKFPFFKTFQATYKVPAGSALAKAACQTCHTPTMKMNPYGADVKAALLASKAPAVTAEILKSVEDLDSNKDGTKNIDHIKAGTLPGEVKGK